MRTRLAALVCAGLTAGVVPGGAMAQTGPQSGPMSAIDWLSDSVSAPQAAPAPPTGRTNLGEPAVSAGVALADVTVTSLGGPVPDAIGILPSSVTGLPRDLWGQSRAVDLARRLRDESPEMLPAIQSLLFTILMAELDPPAAEAAPASATLFLARVDRLLAIGALDQAEALLARAGPDDAEVFRRWFDVTLLLGEENKLCQILSDSPQLSPTYQARIFCLARMRDWDGAALLLGTGRALGLIPEDDAALFARFLDPDLFEGEPPLAQPVQPSPLTFRMFEAIGDAIPTSGLPVAFAQSDLRSNIGWKARIDAAERLSRTGAVSDDQLLGLYTERRAAASGGAWSRVQAVQDLEDAIADNDTARVASLLPRIWRQFEQARLEVPLAHVYGAALAAMTLPGSAGEIAFRMGLLSDEYETVAQSGLPKAADATDLFLAGVAQGRVTGLAAPNARAQAVLDGFLADGPPARLASLIETDRLGEAILRAMELFGEGAMGDVDQVSDAIALFRAVGLVETARRASLEYLILDRRG